MGRRAIVAFVLGACVVLPASAHAGSYDVYSCKFGSSFYGNNAWVAVDRAGRWQRSALHRRHHVREPPAIALCGRRYSPACSTRRRSSAGLAFLPPTNTRITDYAVTLRQLLHARRGLNIGSQHSVRHVDVRPVCVRARRATTTRASVAYVTQDQHYWGAAGPIDKTRDLVQGRLATQLGRAGHRQAMALSAGCWPGRTAVCSLGAPGRGPDPAHRLEGHDRGHRAARSCPACRPAPACWPPGVRSGDEPVTFSATDNSGIRRAEIVDVTDAANPAVVASEDYDSGPNTDAGHALRLHAPAPVPGPQERDDRRVRRRSRAIGRCSCA